MKQYKNFEAEKGKEINQYMEKFQIRFVDNPAAAAEQTPGKQPAASSSAVLVNEWLKNLWMFCLYNKVCWVWAKCFFLSIDF